MVRMISGIKVMWSSYHVAPSASHWPTPSPVSDGAWDKMYLLTTGAEMAPSRAVRLTHNPSLTPLCHVRGSVSLSVSQPCCEAEVRRLWAVSILPSAQLSEGLEVAAGGDSVPQCLLLPPTRKLLLTWFLFLDEILIPWLWALLRRDAWAAPPH